MILLYITDVHGGFEKVKNLLYETVADAYIISGDLIDIPFYNMETAIRYHEIQTYFQGLRRKMERDDLIIEDFVDLLLEMPDVPDEIEEKGTKYQQYTIRARRVMQQKYKVLENIISLKQKSRIFCLPGNYDMDLKFTSLYERDLHMHSYQFQHLKIAGYGGADIWTAGIPERYVISYKGGIGIDDRKNEMYRFFKKIHPDIIVAHQPAHGIHDRLSYMGPSGSPALRTYCDNNNVILCLTGHIHNDWGCKKIENTMYLNPSNFGDVTNINGEVFEGGFFFLVEMYHKHVAKVILKKIVEFRIYDIAEYFMRNDKMIEEIIDKERYNALVRRENYDSKIRKHSHIPEIKLFNEIKDFFRMFQTEETEERLDKMELVTKLLEQKLGMDIAMDVVGSVNVGLSQPSSDIDFVLYMRCGKECEEDLYQCKELKLIEENLHRILGSDFKFEIIDCVNLNRVEQSIQEKNYECELTQRFVAYRSICRAINYRVISPVEDLLNQDMEFRNELEGSIRSYFRIFTTTSQHVRSFDKYEHRLKSIGIHLPESIRNKIRRYLQNDTSRHEKPE